MYIVLFYENVMSLRLFCRSVVGCHILEVSFIFTGFGTCPMCSCYDAEVLLNHKFRKENFLYRFSTSNTA